MRQRTTGICYKTDRYQGQKKFLFHSAEPKYFREVLMDRFSTARSGAQLSGKVTLKHAHSSRFAHPTTAFDPSIHINIERPTRYQKEKKSPLPSCSGGAARFVVPVVDSIAIIIRGGRVGSVTPRKASMVSIGTMRCGQIATRQQWLDSRPWIECNQPPGAGLTHNASRRPAGVLRMR